MKMFAEWWMGLSWSQAASVFLVLTGAGAGVMGLCRKQLWAAVFGLIIGASLGLVFTLWATTPVVVQFDPASTHYDKGSDRP